MSDNLAALTLQALVQVPGALRFITNEVRPDLRKDAADPRSPISDSALAADAQALYKPDTFVIHDVVRLEGPDAKGKVRAYTAEGDWCEGQPEALLKRLQEWRA